jgi:hypothetical protein
MIHTLAHIEPDYGLAVDPFVEWNEIHRPIAVDWREFVPRTHTSSRGIDVSTGI